MSVPYFDALPGNTFVRTVEVDGVDVPVDSVALLDPGDNGVSVVSLDAARDGGYHTLGFTVVDVDDLTATGVLVPDVVSEVTFPGSGRRFRVTNEGAAPLRVGVRGTETPTSSTGVQVAAGESEDVSWGAHGPDDDSPTATDTIELISAAAVAYSVELLG